MASSALQRIVRARGSLPTSMSCACRKFRSTTRGLAGNPGHDQPALLAALLPGFQLFFGAAVDEWTADGQRRRFGNLIATRLPVAQLQHHPLPYPADGGVRSMPRMCTVLTVRDPMLGPVRVMTTHLEFYSKPQRMAQAQALRALHEQATAHAVVPPELSNDGSPFQSKVHTDHAILCGDFNFEAHEPEYAVLTRPGRCGPPVGRVAGAAWGRAAAAHFPSVRSPLWTRSGDLRLRLREQRTAGQGAQDAGRRKYAGFRPPARGGRVGLSCEAARGPRRSSLQLLSTTTSPPASALEPRPQE